MNNWLKTHATKEGIFISCDGTNVPSSGQDIGIVDLGHSKNDTFEDQVSYTLLTDQNILRPLFLEEYSGSSHDIEALKPLFKMFKNYDIKNIKFLLDRGYFSQNLMKEILEDGNNFILKMKINALGKEQIDLYRDNNQNEIDLVILKDGTISRIECKSGMNYKAKDISSFKCLDNSSYLLGKGGIVCTTNIVYKLDDNNFVFPIAGL